MYPRHEIKAGDSTVAELTKRCFHHQADTVGVGEHQPMRLMKGD